MNGACCSGPLAALRDRRCEARMSAELPLQVKDAMFMWQHQVVSTARNSHAHSPPASQSQLLVSLVVAVPVLFATRIVAICDAASGRPQKCPRSGMDGTGGCRVNM